MDHRRTLGLEGEKTALEFLLQLGYRLVERNYRCRLGEIDLVMRDKSQIVIVEVRAKASLAFGTALESITFKKRTKLRVVAQQYLMRYGLQEADVRFDIVSIWKPPGGPPVVEHIKGAF